MMSWVPSLPRSFFVLCLVAFAILVGYSILPYRGNAARRPFDLFIYSSYFYERSQSLGDNSVAIVFTGDYRMVAGDQPFYGLSFTSYAGDKTKISTGVVRRVTPSNFCKWIVYEAVVPVLPGTERLEIHNGDSRVGIPLSSPVKRKHDVVTCISPLFANEQWQKALFALHVYKRFGSHVHLYLTSMVAPLFEVIQEYENRGYVTLQPWLRVVLKSIPESTFNPNLRIELRNQAAAQTDCLLKYKESASFISFLDLDDVLIPRIGDTYFQEFHTLTYNKPIPYIHYTKQNTEVLSRYNGEDFSLSEMLSSIKFIHKKETGKPVVIPKYVNSTWIHWPTKFAQGMKSLILPSHINAITHIKTLKREEGRGQETLALPKFDPIEGMKETTKSLFSAEDAAAMREDFSRMQSVPEVAQRMPLMPKKFFYLTLIAECFEKNYYQFIRSNRQKDMKCFGPDRCPLPASPGILCYNSRAEYHSSEGTEYNIHFATQEGFLKEDGCKI